MEDYYIILDDGNSSKRDTNRKTKKTKLFENFRYKNGIENDEILEKFSFGDCVFLVIIFFISLFVRIFRVHFPQKPINEEVKYGTFLRYMFNGRYFNGTRDVLSPIIVLMCSILSTYKGSLVYFEGETFRSMEYMTIRIINIFFSAVVVPISFFIASLSGLSSTTCIIVSLCIALDPLFISNQRYFNGIGIYHFLVSLCILFVLIFKRFLNILNLVMIGFMAGLCLSVDLKFIFILFVLILDLLNYNLMNIKLEIYRKICTYILCTSFCVMLACYSIHLQLLPVEEGKSEYVPAIIRNSLSEYNKIKSPKDRSSIILRSLVSFMYKNKLERYDSAYSSYWFQWPLHLCKTPLLYSENNIYLLSIGNVFTYAPLFLLNVLSIFSYLEHFNNEKSLFFGVLYISTLFSSMSPFSYHYFPEYIIPLYFSYYSGFAQVEKMKGFYKGFIYSFFVVFSLIGFLISSAYIYGFSSDDLNFVKFFGVRR